MYDLLGFAVLTGPLWLILLLLPLAIFIAVKVSKRFKPGGTRFAAGVGIFLLVYFIPFADELAGRAYLNYLCATQAGVKVYQKVELPGEYWNKEGKPMFRVYEKLRSDHETMFDMNGSVWEDTRLEYRHIVEPFRPYFHIDRASFRLSERKSGKLFGEVVYFMYWHGWLARNFSVNRSAVSCEMNNLDDWALSVFKPVSSTQ